LLEVVGAGDIGDFCAKAQLSFQPIQGIVGLETIDIDICRREEIVVIAIEELPAGGIEIVVGLKLVPAEPVEPVVGVQIQRFSIIVREMVAEVEIVVIVEMAGPVIGNQQAICRVGWAIDDLRVAVAPEAVGGHGTVDQYAERALFV